MKVMLIVLLVVVAWATTEAFERTALGDSIDKATLKVLKEAYQQSEDKNVVTSPLGVFLLLSLYSAGAGPATRQEINSFLGGGDEKQLTETYSRLSNDFASMDPSYLTLANKAYVSEGSELVETFAEAVRSFKSEVDKINFLDREEAAQIMNAWAAEKTQGHITSPIQPSDIDPDTVVTLINVIFFEGNWAVPFDKTKTKDEDFHVDKETKVRKPSMTLMHSLPYYNSEDLGASLIELGYKEDGFRMIVVLPNEIDGLSSVLEKISQKGLLEDVFKMQNVTVSLSFPKFEIRSKLDFKDILTELGVSKIFEESTGGIVRGEQATVNKIIQEATVKVDEKGAIATAVSAMFVLSRMFIPTILPDVEVNVDHPFLFYILHDDKVLFAGTYTH